MTISMNPIIIDNCQALNSLYRTLNYSTTRIVVQEIPCIKNRPEDKYNSLLILPNGKGRKGEGGLRTQGYFKHSLPDKPLITVITVVFNGQQYLEKTILSVIEQSYDNVEYIIIDGGSNDGTIEIIKKYEHAIDYWVSENDCGIYDAWNKGVILSQGSWIAFIGSDDVYLPRALERYSKLFFENKKTDYISSQVNLLVDNKIVRTIGIAWQWNKFKKYMCVAHVGSLHARRIFKEKGLYDSNLKIVGDYELLLRFKEKLNAVYLNDVTAMMRVNGASDSNCRVFFEVEMIKIRHTNRLEIIIKCEMIFAYIKWITRKLFWY